MLFKHILLFVLFQKSFLFIASSAWTHVCIAFSSGELSTWFIVDSITCKWNSVFKWEFEELIEVSLYVSTFCLPNIAPKEETFVFRILPNRELSPNIIFLIERESCFDTRVSDFNYYLSSRTTAKLIPPLVCPLEPIVTCMKIERPLAEVISIRVNFVNGLK